MSSNKSGEIILSTSEQNCSQKQQNGKAQRGRGWARGLIDLGALFIDFHFLAFHWSSFNYCQQRWLRKRELREREREGEGGRKRQREREGGGEDIGRAGLLACQNIQVTDNSRTEGGQDAGALWSRPGLRAVACRPSVAPTEMSLCTLLFWLEIHL